jgi:Xaa-Pro aminopeptidase
VVIGGYRRLHQHLVVGKEPTADQQRLHDLCTAAMAAGEKSARGAACSRSTTPRDVFERAGGPTPSHHAGHGLGLASEGAVHRPPRDRDAAGRRCGRWSGLYIAGVGGIRIEHNYLITDRGCERLSNHACAALRCC